MNTDINILKLKITNVFNLMKILPIQILLIGSLANGTANNNSDADIMALFKRKNIPNNNLIKNLLVNLEFKLNRKVDLIIMEKKDRFVNHDENDLNFLEIAESEAIELLNSSKVGKEFINFSKKVGLYKL